MEQIAGTDIRLQRPGVIPRFWASLRRALISSYKNNVIGTSKGAAYSALLAFFPVLTTLTALLVQANALSISQALSAAIFEVVPPGTEEIVRYNFAERGQRPVYLLITATLISLWAASGVMASLMQGFQAAYGIPSGRPFFRQRAVAILLVIYSALPVLAASALIVFGVRIERTVLSEIGMLPEGDQLRSGVWLFGQLVRYVVSLCAIVFGISLLYYIGPNRRMEMRSVLPGALLAAALWWGTTTLFGWYVRNIANYNVFYGSIGAVIALLVWMYLLSVIALFGCEYNAQREQLAEGVWRA